MALKSLACPVAEVCQFGDHVCDCSVVLFLDHSGTMAAVSFSGCVVSWTFSLFYYFFYFILLRLVSQDTARFELDKTYLQHSAKIYQTIIYNIHSH